MTQSLDTLDQKIQSLLQKKKDLEQKQAQTLLKTLRPLMGEKLTPALAAIIIKETWSSSSKETKDRWLKATSTFCKSTNKSDKNNPTYAKD